MSSIALTERTPLLIAVEGTRIPRRAWSCVLELTQLLADAGQIVEAAEGEADEVRRRAREEGFATGAAAAQAQVARHLLDAQVAARKLVARSDERVVALAILILQRIAPNLGEPQVVAALAAEALRGLQSERHLHVHVRPQAEQATRALLEQWQLTHPEIESAQVLLDEGLPPFGCVVESELGRIEAGLGAQLEAVRECLTAAVAESQR
jgi:flagellar biosynthesis/type III secretory pathway protein FliH